MIFYSFFKNNINEKIEVILKDSKKISGTLLSVDLYLNLLIKEAETDIPYLPSMSICSIRGSSVKAVKIKNNNNIKELNDSTRFRFI